MSHSVGRVEAPPSSGCGRRRRGRRGRQGHDRARGAASGLGCKGWGRRGYVDGDQDDLARLKYIGCFQAVLLQDGIEGAVKLRGDLQQALAGVDGVFDDPAEDSRDGRGGRPREAGRRDQQILTDVDDRFFRVDRGRVELDDQAGVGNVE